MLIISFRGTSCCRLAPCEFSVCFSTCKFCHTAGRQSQLDSEHLQCGGSCYGALCRSKGSRKSGQNWMSCQQRIQVPPARILLPPCAAVSANSFVRRRPVLARPGLRHRSRSSLKLEGCRTSKTAASKTLFFTPLLFPPILDLTKSILKLFCSFFGSKRLTINV